MTMPSRPCGLFRPCKATYLVRADDFKSAPQYRPFFARAGAAHSHRDDLTHRPKQAAVDKSYIRIFNSQPERPFANAKIDLTLYSRPDGRFDGDFRVGPPAGNGLFRVRAAEAPSAGCKCWF